ncbi:hypothetical protein M0802_012290 [Mischocyttarus mexicanus]|nr:hypothetical protein M0802_012290 [Mischocyttarus mexicanus]
MEGRLVSFTTVNELSYVFPHVFPEIRILYTTQPCELTILNRGLWSVGRGVAHGLGSSESYDSAEEGYYNHRQTPLLEDLWEIAYRSSIHQHFYMIKV